MVETLHFEANGKLLITGEYLVLKGAEALAMPVRFGQTLQVHSTDDQRIHWTSEDPNGIWFSTTFHTAHFNCTEDKKEPVSTSLSNLFIEARNLNPSFLSDGKGACCEVSANYPVSWGLGSSSTLIALVARWASVDKFELFKRVSKGSGYDIACSDQTDLLYYRLKGDKSTIELVKPGAAFRKFACFAYLGKKQDTAIEVSRFLSQRSDVLNHVERVSTLARNICNAHEVSELCALVEEHEEILSHILRKEKLSTRIKDFPGSMKSLGAWGGDFGMFVSPLGPEATKTWLINAGLAPAFTFSELEI